ncbi:MAG: hypothetical protein V3V08_05570 [Nannocystaceae bacterium]
MRLVIVMLVFPLVVGCAGTKGGAVFDDLCIAGRLKPPSAEWLNRNPHNWKPHSDYEHPIRAGDRILNRECSAVVIAAGERDAKGFWKSLRKVFRIGG